MGIRELILLGGLAVVGCASAPAPTPLDPKPPAPNPPDTKPTSAQELLEMRRELAKIEKRLDDEEPYIQELQAQARDRKRAYQDFLASLETLPSGTGNLLKAIIKSRYGHPYGMGLFTFKKGEYDYEIKFALPCEIQPEPSLRSIRITATKIEKKKSGEYFEDTLDSLIPYDKQGVDRDLDGKVDSTGANRSFKDQAEWDALCQDAADYLNR